jgi:recombinational DNA repair protein (RecF pathway)
MAKKQSCSRCHTLINPGAHANKFKGAVFCDNCYPGVPPHIGHRQFEATQKLAQDKAFLKRTMPGMEKEIDQLFKE